METFDLPNCQKELVTGDTMQVSIARHEHEATLSRLMSGPGDSEGAMHKAERIFGLSYWCQFNLRHKRRASLPFMAKIHAAYVSVLERSVRRDLEALKTERAKDNDDAELAGLVAQAEALLAEIAARKSKQNGG